MDIGVPRERRNYDSRVGLTPAGVELLTAEGHTCYVELGAGLGAGFSDHDYEKAGARIVYSGEEVYGRAELVLKVSRPTVEEFEWLRDGQIVMGFLHLAAARRDKVELLLKKRVTAIAYETIENDDGTLPVLAPISQIAGRMCPHVAATLLQNDQGGKGVLLGGVPGVPPAEVVILGAGTSAPMRRARSSARARGLSSWTTTWHKLQHLDELFVGRVTTMVSHTFNIRKVVTFADVLVGAVLVPGARTPIVVTPRDGRVDEPALAHHGHLDRPGRLRRDHPADDAWHADLHRRKRHSLLRAEHDGRRGPHRHPRAQQRGLAVHPARSCSTAWTPRSRQTRHWRGASPRAMDGSSTRLWPRRCTPDLDARLYDKEFIYEWLDAALSKQADHRRRGGQRDQARHAPLPDRQLLRAAALLAALVRRAPQFDRPSRSSRC